MRIKKTNDEKKTDVLVTCIDRKIKIYDDITAESVLEISNHIDKLEKEKKTPIVIEINSAGGNIYDGLALYDRIRQSECHIITIGTGIIASMAVIIFLAGDERIISENSIFLNHQGSTTGEDGRTHDIVVSAKEMLRLEEQAFDIISERTGLSIRKIKTSVREGDDYITPERALDEGFAEKIIKNKRTYRRKKK